MSIDRLSSTAALIAALRTRGTRRGEAGARTAKTAKTDSQAAASRKATVASLRRQLVDLVADVVPGDEEAMHRARGKVVRAILLWEFGPELREHAQWQPMLETLVATLEADPGQRENFASLIADLQREAQKK